MATADRGDADGFLLAAVLAVYAAASFLLGEYVARRLRIPLFVTLPIAWTAFEWVRTYFPIGFPWNLLGYAAYRNLALIQFSEFTGVYGVSALIMFFNAVVYGVLFAEHLRAQGDLGPVGADRPDGRGGRFGTSASSSRQSAARGGQSQGRDGPGQYPAKHQVGCGGAAEELRHLRRAERLAARQGSI